MKIKSTALLQELREMTLVNQRFAENFINLSEEELNRRIHETGWSVLECIEHLNLYGNFYLPEITRRIKSSATTPEQLFKSGWLGNYFANSMLPKERLNKMKTFREMNPINSKLDKQVLNTFIEQQKNMLELLVKAEKVSLNKVKTGISISKLIKLKLGDTLRVVIYHNKRHIVQAQKVLGNTE